MANFPNRMTASDGDLRLKIDGGRSPNKVDNSRHSAASYSTYNTMYTAWNQIDDVGIRLFSLKR